MENPNEFKQIELLAYQGDLGRLRERFCIEYIAHKQKLIPLIEESLSREAMLNSEEISCSKGCDVCCSSYIVASLQECEAIVYWLYHHPEKLSSFIKKYRSWREQIAVIEPVFRIIKDAGESGSSPIAMAPYLNQYRQAKIPCPFLDEGACSIYEVRPWACAGIVSVSPREWCDASHPHWGELKAYRFETYVMFEKPFYVKLALPVYLGCLPETIHQLLEEGYRALAKYPGFEP